MSKVFEIRDLRKEYGGLLALDLPSLDVMQGELLSLVGRNGSGKSTLLRMMAFLEKPSSGVLEYFGGTDPRREVTLLLQAPYLLKCTVFENVTLGLRLRGDRHELKARYAEAMQAAGFAEPEAFASRFSSQLSGGERQRISLASRLILKPRVLLLDEPTGGLDPVVSGDFYALIEELNRKNGITVIMVSHDMGMSMKSATHVLHMKHRPLFFGEREAYLTSEAYKQFAGGYGHA